MGIVFCSGRGEADGSKGFFGFEGLVFCFVEFIEDDFGGVRVFIGSARV